MKIEKIIWITIVVAFILRLINVPGHGLLTVLSLSSLAIIYFPGGFYFFCDRKIMRQNIPFSIISGSFLSIIPIGIMYKLQNYFGMDSFLMIGLVSGIALFIVTYFLRKNCIEDLKTYFNNMYLRTMVLAIAIIFFNLLPYFN